MYEELRYLVRYERLMLDWFLVMMFGVCQGCILLLFMFLLDIDWLMRKMIRKMGEIVFVLYKFCSEWYICIDKFIKLYIIYVGKKINLKKMVIN